MFRNFLPLCIIFLVVFTVLVVELFIAFVALLIKRGFCNCSRVGQLFRRAGQARLPLTDAAASESDEGNPDEDHGASHGTLVSHLLK